jgi:hypothetical protein
MAILFLVTALALGAALALELPVRLHLAEKAALSITAGLLLSTWLLWLCTVAAGYGPGAWIALAAQAGLSAALAARRLARARREPGRAMEMPSAHAAAPATPTTQATPAAPDSSARTAGPDAEAGAPPRCPGWAVAVLGLASLAVLWPLFSSHMLEARAGGWRSGGWTAVDFLHHMAFAARFAEQSTFAFDSPLASGEPLTYPFLIDFLSGSLMRMGLSPRMSFLLPGLLLTLAGAHLLFFVSLRLFARARAAAAAVAIFFLSGSAAGLYYFWQDWQKSGEGLGGFLLGMRRQYAQIGDKGIHLGNVVCNEILPQRGVPLGLAVFLAVLLLMRAGSERSGRARAVLLVAAGALTGLLPFAHIHTFLTCVALLGWFAAAELLETRSARNAWTAALAAAIALALPQLWWQFGGVGGGFLRVHLGWLRRSHENPILFWLANLGLVGLFLVGNTWIVWRLRRRSPFHIRLYAPLLVLFAACNVVALQPAVYDNSKIFYYTYLGVALYAGYALAVLSERGRAGAAGAIVLLLAMTLVGGLSLLRESRSSAIVYRTAELRQAAALDRAVPPDARILADEKNPVPFLAGRAMALGLRQTLVNHGARFAQLERDVRAMFAPRPQSLDLYCRHHVTHALIGPLERRRWKPSPLPPWMRPVELGEPGVQLYEIDPRACALAPRRQP